MNKFHSFRAALAVALVAFGAVLARAQQSVQTWLMIHQTSGESFFVTDPIEYTRLTQGGWESDGTGVMLSSALLDAAGMQRLVKGSPEGNDRIFAITPEQVAAAEQAGYHSEGVMGFVSPTNLNPSMVPVYHFTKDSRNLWMINQAGRPAAEKAGWKLQGVAFWLWPKTAS